MLTVHEVADRDVQAAALQIQREQLAVQRLFTVLRRLRDQGLAILFMVAMVGLGGAVLLGIYRDADPEAAAEAVRTESVPLTKAPYGASYLPFASAVALGVTALGWVQDQWLFRAGLAGLAGIAVAWTVRAWAERSTGDEVVNEAIYRRIIDPVRVPDWNQTEF